MFVRLSVTTLRTKQTDLGERISSRYKSSFTVKVIGQRPPGQKNFLMGISMHCVVRSWGASQVSSQGREYDVAHIMWGVLKRFLFLNRKIRKKSKASHLSHTVSWSTYWMDFFGTLLQRDCNQPATCRSLGQNLKNKKHFTRLVYLHEFWPWQCLSVKDYSDIGVYNLAFMW